MIDPKQIAAMQLVANAIEDLVDGISADEAVVTQAMCLALGKRVAALCAGHEDCSERVQQIARGVAVAAATFMNAKVRPA